MTRLSEFLKAGPTAQGKAAVLLSDPTTPDDAAEHLRLSQEHNVPRELVQQDPDAYRRLSEKRNMAQQLSGRSSLSSWLSDPDNVVVAKDDVNTLGWFESLPNAIERGGRRALASLEALTPMATARAGVQNSEMFKRLDEMGLRPDAQHSDIADALGLNPMSMQANWATWYVQNPERRRQLQNVALGRVEGASVDLAPIGEELARASEIPMSAAATRFKDIFFEADEVTFGDILSMIASDPSGATAFLTEVAAETLPVLAGATVATGLSGTPAAGVSVMGGASFAMESMVEVYDFLREKGLDPDTREGWLQIVSDQDVFREANARGMTRGLIIGALDTLSGGVAGRVLAESPLGDIALQAIAQGAMGAGGEAAAQLATDSEIDLREVVVEGLAEFVTAPIEVLGVAGRSLGRRAESASAAGGSAVTLAQIDDMAGQSALKARAPDRFRDFLDQTNLAGMMISVPAQDLSTFFQAREVPFNILEIDPEVYDEALAAGSDVHIPASVYAHKIAGTEMAPWLHEHATLDADEMSMSEAARFNEAWQDEMMRAWEYQQGTYQADLDARAGDIRVKDAIFGQLRAAGRSPDVADRESQVWAAFFRTMGERYGENALDLARQFGVRIEGLPSAQQRVRDNIDIALNTLRKSGAPEMADRESLVDFVIGRGGIASIDEFTDQPEGLVLPVDTTLADLQAELDRRGIDLAMPNDEIVAALEQQNGEPLFQAPPPVESAAFKKWFGDSKVVDSNGNPLVVYHGTFDPEEPRILYQDSAAPRGSVTFPSGGLENGETVIKLFEGADLSTLLHESGHFFLEAFRTLAEREDAPEDMRTDLEVINHFLGHDSGAYGVEPQEKWARGFEAYLMEGKAPSLELADAFARFKAWLTRIYRSIARLNVNLTDEVREVMDRMLATDAEIAEARSDMEIRPLFSDAEVAGMTDSEFRPYQRMARRSAEQAEQRLLEKTMAKFRREREAWYRSEKKAVREEVEASANRRREYRLIEMLANQRWLDEGVDDVPDTQIDRRALVDRFGEGVLAEITRARIGGKRVIYSNGGESPDVVADMFGFSSADEMVRVLQNTIKRKDFINQEVERVMVERHGDPLGDGSIEEDALAAIHSEQQAQTVAAEARHLASRIGKDQRNITARLFRQRASAMLGRMEVRLAARPAQFLKAERQAARSAQRAFSDIVAGRGDAEEKLAEAQRFKEQQLLNHYLYAESRDLESEVKRGREKMRSYSKASVREKLAGGYIEQIDQILDDYEFRILGKKEVDRRVSLREYIDQMTAAGRENELAIDDRLVDSGKRAHYSRLSVDELRGLFDTIANIDHMGRFKQKLIDAKEKRDFDAAIAPIVQGIGDNLSGNPPKRGDTKSDRQVLRQYLNLIKTADTFIREIDGYADLGPAWRNIKQPVDEGMARLTERRDEMARALDDIYSMYSSRERVAMHKPRPVDGVPESLSKWTVISMALNTGNTDNFDRLMSGKGGFAPGEIQAALDTLDEKDWRFVQSMWDYINSFWPEIEAKEKRLTGVVPKKVDAKPMVPAFPFVRGGYYPIGYDARFSGRVTDNEAKEMSDLMRGGKFGKAQTRKGHTKERTASGGQTLKLGMEVAHRHLNQVIYDLEMNEPLVNAWRILQDDRVKDAFKSKSREADRKALEWWVQDAAAGDQIRAEGLEVLLRHVRSGFTTSRLAMNFSTAAIQWTGLFQSSALIGKRTMLNGFMSYLRRPQGWADDIAAVSPVMRKRQQTFERDVMNLVGQIEVGPISDAKKFWRNHFVPAMFMMMQKVQYYTVDIPTWVAAYEAKLGETDNEADARTHADQMVRRAQGSGALSDRGALERGTMKADVRQSEWARTFTALGSYMFAKFNVAYERAGRTNFKSPSEILSLTIDYLMLFALETAALIMLREVVPALLSEGELPEDDDLAMSISRDTLATIAAMFPVARELSGAVQGFSGGGIFGSAIETIARPLAEAAQGEIDKSAIKATVSAAGIGMIGLPASQINTGIDALFNADLDFRDDAAPIEYFIKPRN